MLFKRILSVFLAAVLVLSLSACAEGKPTLDIKNPSVSAPSSKAPESTPSDKEEKPAEKLAVNPLTGEETLKLDAVGQRPVAVIINNAARSVQSGIPKADVLFEVEVEGGVTRLLALFSDPTVVGNIGTIRSMRVPFADIARGMNAVLFFHGMDENHCRPHLSGLGLKYIEVQSGTSGFREQNGLAYEHRLTTSGAYIDQSLEKYKVDMSGTEENWLNFAETADKTPAGENSAKKVILNATYSTKNIFVYDEAAKKYTRTTAKGTEDTDYYTGEKEQFTNLFILNTTYTSCARTKGEAYYHRFANLSSGSGYYVSAGGVTEIKWSKGNASDNFKFTTAEGEDLTVNRGNSYVCIKQTGCAVTFE